MTSRIYAIRNYDTVYIPQPVHPTNVDIDGATAPHLEMKRSEPNYERAENGLHFRKAVRDMLSAFSILIDGKYK